MARIDADAAGELPVRVMALHALTYCERLFYLEEVEEIRVADAAVYQGRTLHEQLAEEEEGDLEAYELESSVLGLRGRFDGLRRRDGRWIVYEHKKGRSARDVDRKHAAWDTDRVQVIAYAMLLEEQKGTGSVVEARVRYHADNVVVRVPLDDASRNAVTTAVARSRALRVLSSRPPVTTEARRCARCSLAPVCLPEEERLARDPAHETVDLSVPDDDREVVHLMSYGARAGRSAEEITVESRDSETVKLPVNRVAHVVVHGTAQISTQALHLCVERDVAVSWLTGGGRFVGTLASTGPAVQRRVRQYRALDDENTRLELARRLVSAKIEGELRYVLRATRGDTDEARQLRGDADDSIETLRHALRSASEAADTQTLLGCEGDAARAYFAAWRTLLGPDVDPRLRYEGRTRRPPRDRVSALLGFGYALLLTDVTAAIVGVGLEPALGFFHQPRSSAPPLALDMMELFRNLLVDIPVIGSIHRKQWDPDADFAVSEPRVWLSDAGRRKFVALYEQRKREEWKHSVVGYSISYGRLIELETRLLEKEWTGAPGLFAKFRLR